MTSLDEGRVVKGISDLPYTNGSQRLKYGGPKMIKIVNSADHQNLLELLFCLFHAFYVAKLALLMLLYS